MMFDDSVGLILIVCWRLARPVTDGPRVIQTGKWDRDRGDVGEGGGGGEGENQAEGETARQVAIPFYADPSSRCP